MARPTLRDPGDDDDDAPWLAEGVREERSTLVPRARLFGGTLVALALAVLVALGVYLASGHKSDGSGGYANPADAPLIAADAGAYKVAPADPGGARITGIDDSVAAVAGGRDQGSAILPDEPEEPLARPAAGAAPVAPPTDLLPHATAPASPPAAPAALPSRAIAAAPVVAPPAARATPQPDTTAKIAGPKAPAKTEATPAKPKAVVAAADADPLAAPAAKSAPSDAPVVKPGAASGGGSVTLQLGAFSTRDKANAAWATAGGDGTLSGLAKRIEPADRDGTTLYRLRAAGVASRDAARALCARIKSAGNACIVAE